MMNAEIKAYYDELATTYDSNRFENSYGRYIDAQEQQFLTQLLAKNNFKTVLDLGCGTGAFTCASGHGMKFCANETADQDNAYPSYRAQNAILR
jgi:ubiquinone/menaquinone biosynthesis C-methylase UbiE